MLAIGIVGLVLGPAGDLAVAVRALDPALDALDLDGELGLAHSVLGELAACRGCGAVPALDMAVSADSASGAVVVEQLGSERCVAFRALGLDVGVSGAVDVSGLVGPIAGESTLGPGRRG